MFEQQGRHDQRNNAHGGCPGHGKRRTGGGGQGVMETRGGRGGCGGHSGKGGHSGQGGHSGRGGKGKHGGRGNSGFGGMRAGGGFEPAQEETRFGMPLQASQTPPRTVQAEAVESAPLLQEPVQSGFCPICKNHCPLSDPTCDKGKAYVQELLENSDGAIKL